MSEYQWCGNVAGDDAQRNRQDCRWVSEKGDPPATGIVQLNHMRIWIRWIVYLKTIGLNTC